MRATHILTDIPQKIQEIYNIGNQVEVEADNSVGGGHFTLINRDGKMVSMDAVELFGTDTLIQKI